MTRVKFESVPIYDNGEQLIDVAECPFVLETVYFNNGWSHLPTHRLRHGVAKKLLQAQESLGGHYQLKIWDAWRPREVQNAIYQDFWQHLAAENPDWSEEQTHSATEQFVTKATNPARIPPHATGGTVDLTLVDKNGSEVDMGTGFDHFGPEAAPHYFKGRDRQITANRELLRKAMMSQGFTPDEDEWWHFDYGCQLWAVRANQSHAIYGEISK